MQADAFDALGGVTVSPITGAREEQLMVRVPVEPNARMVTVNQMLAVFLGLA